MKTKSLYLYLVALACLLPFCGCSDEDDVVTTPLATPVAGTSYATVSTLLFEWDAVAGATQYAYELRNPNGALIDGDVTNTTSAYFSRLEDNTTYTLSVWAYAAYGSEKSRSEVATLTATTLPIIQLAMPQPTAKVDGGSVTITWEAVPDAQYYTYCLHDEAEAVVAEGTTTETVLSYNLATGNYVLHLSACSDAEDRSQSEEASVAFAVERIILYRAAGTFHYGTSDWQAVITAYQGGAYSIAAWYGEKDYDFNFLIGADDAVTMPDYYNDGYYIYVPMSGEYNAYLYDGYNSIERNGSTITLWFYEYYAGDWCSFTWDDPTAADITVDDIVGRYKEAASGIDYYVWDWGTSDYSFSYDDNEVTIEKVDDFTVAVKGFYWVSETLNATLDAASRTLTFAAGQTFASWYTFAAASGADAPVVGQIAEDGSITINGWSAWYSGSAYVTDAVTTLTRIAE